MSTLFQDAAERFEHRMQDIRLNYGDDPEVCHGKMDDLMCETLEEFGCHAGVQIFKDAPKYYS